MTQDFVFFSSYRILNGRLFQRGFLQRLAQKYDFNWLVRQVAEALDMQPDDVLAPGRYKNTVKARSVLCCWGTRDLGLTTVELAQGLHLSQPTVSHSATRGRTIALEKGLRLNMGPQ